MSARRTSRDKFPRPRPPLARGRDLLSASCTGSNASRGPPLRRFLALHFAVWTALPALLYANLPLDLIEALIYGRQWQLGYDKLPPLPWWLVEIAHRLFGTDAAYYALAQASVVIAFALVFATARPLVGAVGALFAVLIIDGMHYFQYTAVKFNHDVIQLPFWALAGYALSCGAHTRTPAALGPAWRRLRRRAVGQIFRRHPRRALCAVRADRSARAARLGDAGAVARADRRAHHRGAASDLAAIRPISCPSPMPAIAPPRCAAGSITSCIRPCSRRAKSSSCCRRCSSPRALFWPKPKPPASAMPPVADAFERRIVTLLAFGPAAGHDRAHRRKRARRGGDVGLSALALSRPVDRDGRTHQLRCRPDRTRGRAPGLRSSSSSLSSSSPITPCCPSSITAIAPCCFRATRWAARLTQRFRDATGAPLRYVIGTMWDGGNLAHYSPDQPQVLIDGAPARAPWIDLADLRKKGAVVVWTQGDPAQAAGAIRRRRRRRHDRHAV